MICDNCSGGGTIWKFSWAWPLRVAKVKCPHCKGTGRNLDVDRMADKMVAQYIKCIRPEGSK